MLLVTSWTTDEKEERNNIYWIQSGPPTTGIPKFALEPRLRIGNVRIGFS